METTIETYHRIIHVCKYCGFGYQILADEQNPIKKARCGICEKEVEGLDLQVWTSTRTFSREEMDEILCKHKELVKKLYP